MPDSYDLTQLTPYSFEHLVNLLALRVLGSGHTGFGPGSDGGRDGYFEGEAPYPSAFERWSGKWYIQCKFHKPHLSKDPQKWLIEQIQEELKEFSKENTKRKWPDNWIIATNIDTSGTPETGAFDTAKELVAQNQPKLKDRFHIWGGRKILDLLGKHPEVAEYYLHFLTPGNVIAAMYNQIQDARAEVETILHHLIVKQFSEQQYTKLEQAGSNADTRPGIHRLFIDLPFQAKTYDVTGLVMRHIVHTASKCHKIDPTRPDTKEWTHWFKHPLRARVLFIKGGPGQGKSTISQYFSQIQRASLILQGDDLTVSSSQRSIAKELQDVAEKQGLWPVVPRIPIIIELKDYAQWLGERDKEIARGILTYLAERISARVEQKVYVGTLKRALRMRSWFVAFDGLDEVPSDIKDIVASEVRHFIDDVALENNIDLLTICTSRPQGYSGQFSDLDGPTLDLIHLSSDQALECAKPVLRIDRSEEEALKFFSILSSAIDSPSVRELMTTPLQAHIMAVVVRDGSRPPERRWQLFNNFYQVIRRREANRNLPDKRLAKLLRQDEQLLKTVHNRLGFFLHMRAETSKGAQTHLNRTEFRSLVEKAVAEMIESDINVTVNVLLSATTDRLVLVSTPDDGDHVRFDIRPLQEFFAAEFLYESVTAEELRYRLELIAGDSHWREVMHFLLSALIENNRKTELSIAVEVLEQLDEGNEESDTRLLSRRLARGALLVARLLQEGVLEQDKRIRQQFRKCLEPITAVDDFEALASLVAVKQSNSRTWLLNFLMDSIKENNYSENVIAASALLYLLSDNDDHVEEFKHFLTTAPTDFLSVVLENRDRRRSGRSNVEIQDWVVKTLLELLLSDAWRELTLGSFNSIESLLALDSKKTLNLADQVGFTEIEVELLKSSLLNQLDTFPDGETVDCGMLQVTYYRNDWSTETLDFIDWKLDSHTIQGSRGIFRFIGLTYIYAVNRDFSSWADLLRYLEINSDLFWLLPRGLRCCLPIRELSLIETEIQEIRTLNSDQLDTFLHTFTPSDRPVKSLSIKGEVNLENFKRMLEYSVSLAINIWDDYYPLRGHMSQVLESPEVINAIADKILASPFAISTNLNLWGQFIKLTPNQDKIRQALKVSKTRPSYPYHGIIPFKLRLPAEAFLLPDVVTTVTGTRIGVSSLEIEKARKSVTDLIQEYIDDLSALERILFESQETNEVKAAAAILVILHPQTKVTLQNLQDILLGFYEEKLPWFLSAVCNCLMVITTEQDPIAKLLVAIILNKARNDYQGSSQLQILLAHWRETSSAPLHSKNAQSKWLDIS